MQKIAVIGLGRFGMAVARRLASVGVQVIAIDRSQQFVNEIKDDVDLAVRLDSTDRNALLSQDIDKVDVCVVAIGENFEASLLTTALVRQLGVPHIVCRAQTAVHAEIFRQIGANQVVQPEQEAGDHTARQLASPQLVDFIPLADDYTLIELRAPQIFQGKPVKFLGLREKYGVNLVVIRRTVPSPEGAAEDAPVTRVRVPKPDDVIEPNDVLFLVGPNESLAKLPKE